MPATSYPYNVISLVLWTKWHLFSTFLFERIKVVIKQLLFGAEFACRSLSIHNFCAIKTHFFAYPACLITWTHHLAQFIISVIIPLKGRKETDYFPCFSLQKKSHYIWSPALATWRCVASTCKHKTRAALFSSTMYKPRGGSVWLQTQSGHRACAHSLSTTLFKWKVQHTQHPTVIVCSLAQSQNKACT